MNIVDPSKNPQIERRIREFLAALNSGGPPIETLSPAAARKVLVDAQLNAISQVPAVRDALHQAAETLRKHLG
jgi:acetyl esterase